jgi:hypothetical protein
MSWIHGCGAQGSRRLLKRCSVVSPWRSRCANVRNGVTDSDGPVCWDFPIMQTHDAKFLSFQREGSSVSGSLDLLSHTLSSDQHACSGILLQPPSLFFATLRPSARPAIPRKDRGINRRSNRRSALPHNHGFATDLHVRVMALRHVSLVGSC